MDYSMIDIIAQGSEASDHWQRTLDVGVAVVVGRESESFQVDWDDRISRQHATLVLRDDQRVQVTRHPKGRNPIFFRGAKRDSFVIAVDEHFVIGSTTFTVTKKAVTEASVTPGIEVTEHWFSPGELRSRGFRNVAGRIDALRRLPEWISGSSSDSELLVRVADVMLQATSSAAEVAILQVVDGKPLILESVCRFTGAREARPSGRLVREAVNSGKSVLHMRVGGPDFPQDSEHPFTVFEDVDWAFAVPVFSDACPGWALYVTGKLSGGNDGPRKPEAGFAHKDLEDDVQFAELVATTLGNLKQMRALQQRQAGLSRFFAPVVMEALAGQDTFEVLKPREADIAVLFCDLRGFSRKSEQQAEHLMGLLERVSEALGIMTKNILRRDGVIGDFHGDAAMGFWGWPLPQEDSAGRACQTALEILADFQRRGAATAGPLGGFRCGIGIATGRGVAGRIGTSDQVKVTAFGPVVNLASRLEGMTKLFSTEILVDEGTADYVRNHLSADTARVRRLAKVRPAGIQTPLVVHQLLPPAGEPGTLADKDIVAYEAALQSLMDHRWEDAFEQLHEVPASDRAKDFLTVFIASHGRVPPENWDGVIPLNHK